MTKGTEGDQVRFFICALMTSVLLVVDLEIASRAADLASPTIPPQHSLTQLREIIRVYSPNQALRFSAHHLDLSSRRIPAAEVVAET
jgi:hypothetical protein